MCTTLRPIAGIGEGAQEAAGKMLSAGEEVLEGHRPGDGPVVKEQIHPAAGGEADFVGPGGVDLPSLHIRPVELPPLADPLGLIGRKDGKANAQLGHDIQRLQIHRSLRKPHPFRLSSKPVLEVP